jgi:hypothetical protein
VTPVGVYSGFNRYDFVRLSAGRAVRHIETRQVDPFDIAIGKCAVIENPFGIQLCILDMTKGPLKPGPQQQKDPLPVIIYALRCTLRRDETSVTIPGNSVALIIIAPPNSVLAVGIAPRSKIPKMMPQTGSRLASRLAD